MDFLMGVSGVTFKPLSVETFVVYEIHQRIAGHGFAASVVHSLVAPATPFGDDGVIIRLVHIPVPFFSVVYL